MSKWIASTFFVLAACGGGSGSNSGVSGDKTIVELSSDEIADVCAYLTEVLPERTVDCGGGETFNLGEGGLAECLDDYTQIKTEHPACALTVSQSEACAEAFAALSDAQLCAQTSFPPECAPLLDEDCL